MMAKPQVMADPSVFCAQSSALYALRFAFMSSALGADG